MCIVSGLPSSNSELIFDLTPLPIRHEALLAFEGPLLDRPRARVIPAWIIELRDVLLRSTRGQELIQGLEEGPFRL